MSLKSLFGKMFGKKDPEPQPIPEEHTEIQHEMSLANTMVEPVVKNDAPGEIEIFINNEKTNIYDIARDTRIGRDPSQTEISIPELIVSKSHCTLYLKDKEIYIKDNNSTNGTYVNRIRVAEQKLEDNDEVMLGKKGTVRFIFHKRPII